MEKKSGELKPLIISLLAVGFASVFPAVFIFCQNADEMRFSEVASIAGLFLMIGYALLAIIALLTRNISSAAIDATVSVLFVSNYKLIQKLVCLVLPDAKYWHIVPVCVVLLIFLFVLLNKKMRDDLPYDVTKIICFVMAGLLAINLIPAFPKMHQQRAEKVNARAENAEGPNIYWIILDECASFKTMHNYYQYTDTTMRNRFESAGFIVSENSYNECGNTDIVVTNCLNLSYAATPEMTSAEWAALRINPPLYQTLMEHGYSLNGIGDTAWLNIDSATTSEKMEGHTVEGKGAKDLLLENTIFYPFFQYTGTEAASILQNALDYMDDSNNFVPDSSSFYLTYLCLPHQPFLFDKDGNAVSPSNYNNWDDPQYYLGQYIYAMKRIIAIAERIVRDDPNSVIVIGSDHGPRFNNAIPYAEKTSVLLNVYVQGRKIDNIDGASTLNALRSILNTLFDCGYEKLEAETW